MSTGSREAALGPGWLHGPVSDLLLGCGLAYLLAAPLLLYVGDAIGATTWSVGWVSLLTIAINTPHYGATLLRVYERREDRRKYVFFAVYVTAVLFLAFLVGLRDALVGSLLITLYISWSPWHFSGQNYGLALMFLRRRGVEVDLRAKRLIYASFVLSFALALLAVHVETSTAIYAPGFESTSAAYRVMRLGIPASLAMPLFGLLGTLYLLSLGGAAARLSRGASLRSLAPAGVLVLTQALWFTVPAVLLLSRNQPLLALPFAAIWISTAHSAQYLWVTSYYAERTGRRSRTLPFLVKSLLAGSALAVLPTLVFMPSLLGSIGWSTGLALLAFSVLNLHHFVLDGAIWKLRDGPVARILLRAGTEPEAVAPASRSWLRPLVWGVGAVCLAVPILMAWELHAAKSNRGDVERLEQAARRLAWIGRDNAAVVAQLGVARERAGQIDAAMASYRDALRVDPRYVPALNLLARALALYRRDEPARVEEAVGLAERASEIAGHRNPRVLDTLAAAEAARGRFDAAQRAAARALKLARARGDTTLAAELEQRIALYRSGRALAPTERSGSRPGT